MASTKKITPKKTAPKKPTAKKPAVKKVAAKKTVEKKTAPKKSAPKTTVQKALPKSPARFLVSFLIGVGILIAFVVVGSAVYWETALERRVGVDFPDELEQNVDAGSILPYICDQDPEACEKAPLTFQGEEEVVVVEPVEEVVIEPESKAPALVRKATNAPAPQMTTTLLGGLEQKLRGFEHLDDIEPLKQQLEISTLLTLLENTIKGYLSLRDFIQHCTNSPLPEVQVLAQSLPADGEVVPLEELGPVLDESFQMVEETHETWWDAVKAWGASLVEIHRLDEGLQIEEFKTTALRGRYREALRLYGQLPSDERKAYAPYARQIQILENLEAMRRLLLTNLAERS